MKKILLSLIVIMSGVSGFAQEESDTSNLSADLKKCQAKAMEAATIFQMDIVSEPMVVDGDQTEVSMALGGEKNLTYLVSMVNKTGSLQADVEVVTDRGCDVQSVKRH